MDKYIAGIGKGVAIDSLQIRVNPFLHNLRLKKQDQVQ